MKILLSMLLATAITAAAQVPSGATPVALAQINTLSGVTTWTFTAGGQTYYLQAPAYLMVQFPGGITDPVPMPPPGLWVAAATTPTSTTSPDLTAIANNDGKSIIDGAGNIWTIVNNQVLENGKPAGWTSGVVKLVIVKGVIWQENSAGGWWYWNVTDVTWDGGAAPI